MDFDIDGVSSIQGYKFCIICFQINEQIMVVNCKQFV